MYEERKLKPTLAETVHVDHEQRLRDLEERMPLVEREVGLPVGGDKAVSEEVKSFIESVYRDKGRFFRHAPDDSEEAKA